MLEAISGFKINLPNSKFINICEVPQLNEWEQDLGVGQTIHLSMPLGASSRAVSIWNPILERFDRKLPMWKRSCPKVLVLHSLRMFCRTYQITISHYSKLHRLLSNYLRER